MNLPRKMVVVLVVVGLLFLAVLFLPLAGIGGGLADEGPGGDEAKTNFVNRVSAPVTIDDMESPCLSGTSLVWSGMCQLSVAPAEGILGRLRFRKFTLIRPTNISQSIQVQYMLTGDGDQPDPAAFSEPSAQVGVPPRGLTIRLFCNTVGGCQIDLDLSS